MSYIYLSSVWTTRCHEQYWSATLSTLKSRHTRLKTFFIHWTLIQRLWNYVRQSTSHQAYSSYIGYHTLARPVQTMLLYARSCHRSLSSVSGEHRATSYTVAFQSATVIFRLLWAADKDKVRRAGLLLRRPVPAIVGKAMAGMAHADCGLNL